MTFSHSSGDFDVFGWGEHETWRTSDNQWVVGLLLKQELRWLIHTPRWLLRYLMLSSLWALATVLTILLQCFLSVVASLWFRQLHSSYTLCIGVNFGGWGVATPFTFCAEGVVGFSYRHPSLYFLITPFLFFHFWSQKRKAWYYFYFQYLQ